MAGVVSEIVAEITLQLAVTTVAEVMAKVAVALDTAMITLAQLYNLGVGRMQRILVLCRFLNPMISIKPNGLVIVGTLTIGPGQHGGIGYILFGIIAGKKRSYVV